MKDNIVLGILIVMLIMVSLGIVFHKQKTTPVTTTPEPPIVPIPEEKPVTEQVVIPTTLPVVYDNVCLSPFCKAKAKKEKPEMMEVPSLSSQTPIEAFLDVLRAVESSGNDFAVWKKDELGPLQIKPKYWQDGCEYGNVDWDYLTYVWYWKNSRQITLWYWERHCPTALYELDFETLARVHNGGPEGSSKKSTDDHWKRVQAQMPKKLKNLTERK